MTSLRRLRRVPREEGEMVETTPITPTTIEAPARANNDGRWITENPDYHYREQQPHSTADRGSSTSSPRQSISTESSYPVTNPYNMQRLSSPRSSSSASESSSQPMSNQGRPSRPISWFHPPKASGGPILSSQIDMANQSNRLPGSSGRAGESTLPFGVDRSVASAPAKLGSVEPSGSYFSEGGRSDKVVSRILNSVNSVPNENMAEPERQLRVLPLRKSRHSLAGQVQGKQHDGTPSFSFSAWGGPVPRGQTAVAVATNTPSSSNSSVASVATEQTRNTSPRAAMEPGSRSSLSGALSSPREHGPFLENKRRQNQPTARFHEATGQKSMTIPQHQQEQLQHLLENRVGYLSGAQRRPPLNDPPTKVPQRRPRNQQQKQRQNQQQNQRQRPLVRDLDETLANKYQEPDGPSFSTTARRSYNYSSPVTLDPPTWATCKETENHDTPTTMQLPMGMISARDRRRPDAPSNSLGNVLRSSHSESTSTSLNTIPSFDPRVVILSDFSTIPSPTSIKGSPTSRYDIRPDPSMASPFDSSSESFEESRLSIHNLSREESHFFDENSEAQDPFGTEERPSSNDKDSIVQTADSSDRVPLAQQQVHNPTYQSKLQRVEPPESVTNHRMNHLVSMEKNQSMLESQRHAAGYAFQHSDTRRGYHLHTLPQLSSGTIPSAQTQERKSDGYPSWIRPTPESHNNVTSSSMNTSGERIESSAMDSHASNTNSTSGPGANLNDYVLPANSIIEEEASSDEQHMHTAEDAKDFESLDGGNAGIEGLCCGAKIEGDNETNASETQSKVRALETIQEDESVPADDDKSTIIFENVSADDQNAPIVIATSLDPQKYATSKPSFSAASNSAQSNLLDQAAFPLLCSGNTSVDGKEDCKRIPSKFNPSIHAVSVTSTLTDADSSPRQAGSAGLRPNTRIHGSLFSDVSSWVDEEDEEKALDANRFNPWCLRGADSTVRPVELQRSRDDSTASTAVHGNLASVIPSQVDSTASTAVRGNLTRKSPSQNHASTDWGCSGSNRSKAKCSDGTSTFLDYLSPHLTTNNHNAKKAVGSPKLFDRSQSQVPDSKAKSPYCGDEPKSQHLRRGRAEKSTNDDSSIGSDKGGSVGSSTAFFDADEEGSLASFKSLESIFTFSTPGADDDQLQETIFTCGPGIFSRTEPSNEAGPAPEQKATYSSFFKTIRQGINDASIKPTSRDASVSNEFSCRYSSADCTHPHGTGISCDINLRREPDGADRIAALRRRELLRRRRLKHLYNTLGDKKQSEDNSGDADGLSSDPNKATHTSSIDANIRAIMLQSRAVLLQKSVRRMLALKAYTRVAVAAIQLQCTARSILAKRRFAERKEAYRKTTKAIAIQACFRRFRAVRTFHCARMCIVLLQTSLRMVQAKERLRVARISRNAAILIQANHRKALAVDEFKLARSCAILIQSHFRRMLWSNEFQLQRIAAVLLQKEVRRMQAVDNLVLIRMSAIFIQRNYRRWVAVNRYEIAKYAAQSIQSLHRRAVAIKEFQATREKIILLQAAWKSFYRQRDYRSLLASTTTLQSLVRVRSARRVYKTSLMAVIVIQTALRTWSSAQAFLRIRCSAIRIQAAWRRALGKLSFVRMLCHLRVVQGFARIWVARREAWIRWCAVVTIQSFERRRQARKALRAARIAWQIETALSNSTNPATFPSNMLLGADDDTITQFRMRPDSPNSLSRNSTPKNYVHVELNSNSMADMDLAASTMDLEDNLPSGCPSMFDFLTGEQKAPARGGSLDTNSLVSVAATRAKRNAAFTCNALQAFPQGSAGSASMDESLAPTRVYSDHSIAAMHDDASAKDFSTSTKEQSSGFASNFSASTRKTSLSSLRDSFRQILACAPSDDVGDSRSGSGSAEELSTAEGCEQAALKASVQTGRDLGGIKIFFADTVEYSDTVDLESNRGSVHDKSRDVVGRMSKRIATDPRHAHVSRTMGAAKKEEATLRDSSDSSLKSDVGTESRARGNKWFDYRPGSFPLSNRHGPSIGDFLESAIDNMCVSPRNMAQFFPPSPEHGAHFSDPTPKHSRASSRSSSHASRHKKNPRPSQRSSKEGIIPRPPQRPSHSDVSGWPSSRVQHRTHENPRAEDRDFVERTLESRHPPSTLRVERSKRDPPSSLSAFQDRNGSPPEPSSRRRSPSPLDGSATKVQQLSFEERRIHSESPSPIPWQSRSPAFHRTPVELAPSRNDQDSYSDLCRNDELFDLLANMLLEFIRTKVHNESTILLESNDLTQIELLLPGTKRDLFIESVRHRLSNLADQSSPLHALVLRCSEFGFDRDDGNNPILASRDLSSPPIYIDLRMGAATEGTNSVASGNGTAVPGGIVRDKETADTELIRQQLTSELKEASNLMTNSQNAETSLFWRNHVLDLQSRLNAIAGSLAGHPEEILERNRKLLSEFRNREQYVPPSLDDDQKMPSVQIKDRKGPKSQQKARDSIENMSPMVDVISPADLPGGYHFEAEIEGQRFLATVPPGGVQQGETFTCVMRELDSVAIDIPVGYWKDGMTSVCRHGCCHVSIWNAIFCPLIALAQIGQRIQLDFLGRVHHPHEDQPFYSNRTMMSIVIIFWLIVNSALCAGYAYKWEYGLEVSLADYSAVGLINLAMIGFTIFVTQSTRYSLREKFMIREERCYDLEDVVCSLFCLPCVVCQMQRHTANYDEYQAVCCSKTGLPDGVGVHSDQTENALSSEFLV